MALHTNPLKTAVLITFVIIMFDIAAGDPKEDYNKCIETIKTYCKDGELEIVSCVKGLVLKYKKTIPSSIPDYIEQYFNTIFRWTINIGFHIPSNFCSHKGEEDYYYKKYFDAEEDTEEESMEDTEEKCIADLKDFENAKTKHLSDKYAIYSFAFSDINMDSYTMPRKNKNARAYLRYISDNIKKRNVRESTEPRAFCSNTHSYYPSSSLKHNS